MLFKYYYEARALTVNPYVDGEFLGEQTFVQW